MANLRRVTLRKNQCKDRWDLTNDSSHRTVRTLPPRQTRSEAAFWSEANSE
jgi:hypothetical protein